MLIEQVNSIFINDAYELIMACKEDLIKNNILQWTAEYPDLESVITDINEGSMYGIFIDNLLLGIVTFNTTEDTEYQHINWEDQTGKHLILHRLAVHPQVQNSGLASRLMNFVEQYAKQNLFSSIRLDAYSDHAKILSFYQKRAYNLKGEVFFPNREFPFFCYEKLLNTST